MRQVPGETNRKDFGRMETQGKLGKTVRELVRGADDVECLGRLLREVTDKSQLS